MTSCLQHCWIQAYVLVKGNSVVEGPPWPDSVLGLYTGSHLIWEMGITATILYLRTEVQKWYGRWDSDGTQLDPRFPVLSHFYTIFRMHAKLLSRVWLCEPMDCSPPGSSVRGFSRQEYWGVAMPFSRRSSRPRDGTHISCSSCIAGGVLTPDSPWKPLTFRSVALLLLSLKKMGKPKNGSNWRDFWVMQKDLGRGMRRENKHWVRKQSWPERLLPSGPRLLL